MKKSLLFFLLAAFLFLPLTAQANLFDAQIGIIIAYDQADNECGVETEITGDEGGFINGTEGLYVDGFKWGDLGGLPLSGYKIGDKISWGTNALALRLGYDFDVTLDEDICKNLTLGSKLTFQGSEGTDIAEFDFDFSPRLSFAYDIGESGSGSYTPVDLKTGSVTITSLDGSQVTVGVQYGPAGDDCSLGAINATGNVAIWFGMFALLGLFGLRRLKK